MSLATSSGGDGRKPPILTVIRGGRSPRKILIDVCNKDEAYALVYAFEAIGCEAKISDLGPDLDLISEESDLLITDDLSGMEMHKADHPELLIVILIGSSGVEAAYRRGADFVLVHPLNMDDPLGIFAADEES